MYPSVRIPSPINALLKIQNARLSDTLLLCKKMPNTKLTIPMIRIRLAISAYFQNNSTLVAFSEAIVLFTTVWSQSSQQAGVDLALAPLQSTYIMG